MTDEHLVTMFSNYQKIGRFPPVRVVASDYEYDGWIVTVFKKRGGKVRCNVEDAMGRLFVHNSGNVHALPDLGDA